MFIDISELRSGDMTNIFKGIVFSPELLRLTVTSKQTPVPSKQIAHVSELV
jgi:hypothetical protein